MGISIQDKSITFSDDFPMMGNIVRNDVLKWGMRPVNAMSSINLAENIGGVQPLNNPALRGDIGFYKTAAAGGSFQATGMSMKDLRKTIFTTLWIPSYIEVGQVWVAGSFTFQEESYYPCGFSLVLNQKSDGLYMWGIANTIESNTSQKALAFAEHKLSKSSGVFCLAATIDHFNGVINTYELNSTTSGTKTASLDYTRYTGPDTAEYPFKWGSSKVQPDFISRGVNFFECFYFNDVLSAFELQQQKEYSKMILNAKGIPVGDWV